MKFLIADDNATNRLVLAAMLKKEGHQVIASEDGKGAVEAFMREQPDMIIMDVMMPVMATDRDGRSIDDPHRGQRAWI